MILAPLLNQHIEDQLKQHNVLPLTTLNQRSRDALQQNMLPEAFSETWKYTKLHALEKGQLTRYSDASAVIPTVPDFAAIPLIIVNGRLPKTLPTIEGIEFSYLDQASTASSASTTFALFNGACLQQGLQIRIAKNHAASSLLHIVFYSTGTEPSYYNTRLRITLADNSELHIIEHYMGDANNVLCNAVTDIQLGENSKLVHLRLQSEQQQCLHIGQLVIQQAKNSRVESFQFMTASALKRNDINVQLKGEGAELEMHGAFIARGNGHVDNQICVEHFVPHCQSHQNYKGIAGDQGQAIFNGRIHILPGASKTNADLSNRNLLLNTGAEINSKPELEIYNDDVKCSHGTTIGQIDPTMRFYLQSRGIDEKQAQKMLSIGFIKQELSSLPFEAAAEWIGDWLGQAVVEPL